MHRDLYSVSDRLTSVSVLLMTLVLVTTPVGATIGIGPTATSSSTAPDTDSAVAAATPQKLTKCQEIDSSGTYILSGSIDADQHDRSPCIHITASNVVIEGGGTLSNGEIRAGGVNEPPLSDVTVKNININGGRVLFDDVTTVVVKDTTITWGASTTSGILSLQDVSDAEITNNQLTGTSSNPPYGIDISTSDGSGASSDIDIANNAISGLNVGVHMIGDGRDDPIRGVTITGNTIETIVGDPNGPRGDGIELRHNSISPTWAEDITITDNVIRSNDLYGIQSKATTIDLTIANNQITQNGADGIAVGDQDSSQSRTTIRNNRVTGNGVDGIYVAGNHTIVTGNNASGNGNEGGFGIEIAGRNATVTDNTVKRNEIPASGSTGGGGMVIYGVNHTIAYNIVNENSLLC